MQNMQLLNMTLDYCNYSRFLKLTNRDELLFRVVLALPNASSTGFD
jgi:hypothetical protein